MIDWMEGGASVDGNAPIGSALGEFHPLIVTVVPRHQASPNPEVFLAADRALHHRRGEGEEHGSVLGQPLGLVPHHQLGPLPAVPVLPREHGLAGLVRARQRAMASSRGRVRQRHVERDAASGMAKAVARHVEDVVETGTFPEWKEVAGEVEGDGRRVRRDDRALVQLPSSRHLDPLDSRLIARAISVRGVSPTVSGGSSRQASQCPGRPNRSYSGHSGGRRTPRRRSSSVPTSSPAWP